MLLRLFVCWHLLVVTWEILLQHQAIIMLKIIVAIILQIGIVESFIVVIVIVFRKNRIEFIFRRLRMQMRQDILIIIRNVWVID